MGIYARLTGDKKQVYDSVIIAGAMSSGGGFMMNKRVYMKFNVQYATAAFFAAAILTGCKLANTGPAPSISIYTGSAPVVYSLSENYNVVRSSVDRNKEGVVLNATLDEYEMPSSWAKVAESGGSYYLYNMQVYPDGADSASFVQVGSAWYAKTITVGVDDPVKNFTAAVSGTSVVYTYTPSSETESAISLPAAALSDANKKWYWEQMEAGNYSALGAVLTDGDYAKTADGTAAFTGVTKANRWLKSANDAAWKSGRDSAITFCKGNILIGAESMDVSASSGKWILGIDDTKIDEDWSFDSYLPILLNAYTTSGETAPDATTGASS